MSDKEHRELLNRVNGDDIIQRIRYNIGQIPIFNGTMHLLFS